MGYASQHSWHAVNTSEAFKFFLKHLYLTELNISISFCSRKEPIATDKQGYIIPSGLINKFEKGNKHGLYSSVTGLFPFLNKFSICIIPFSLGLNFGAHLNFVLECFDIIGKKRGALVSGGNVDDEKTANIILDDFRSGRIGRISLEKP